MMRIRTFFFFIVATSVISCASGPSHRADSKTVNKCAEVVEKAAVRALVGEPPRSDYKVLGSTYLGLANRRLGNLRLHAFTVEISDEADGGLMLVLTEMPQCRVHDTVFASHALSR